MYLFPIAAMTNYHKFNGLKQHKTFGGQKSELGLRGQNQGVSTAAFLSGGSKGGSIFLLSLALRGYLCSLAVASYSVLTASSRG